MEQAKPIALAGMSHEYAAAAWRGNEALVMCVGFPCPEVTWFPIFVGP